MRSHVHWLILLGACALSAACKAKPDQSDSAVAVTVVKDSTSVDTSITAAPAPTVATAPAATTTGKAAPTTATRPPTPKPASTPTGKPAATTVTKPATVTPPPAAPTPMITPAAPPAAAPAPAPPPAAAPVQTASAEGRTLYLKNCRTCHGATGTPSSETKAKYPKIKTLSDAAFMATVSNDSILNVIRNGAGRDMKSFADRLTADEMVEVMRYVRTLAVKP